MIIDNSGETNINLTADENVGSGQSISFSELDSNSGNPRLADIKKAESEVSEPVSDEKSDVQEQKVPESPKSGKKVTFNDGTQAGELSADIKLRHKVDGKEVEWTLQELLNDKAGQTSWDKKFQELSAERSKFKQERDVIEKYIEGFQHVARKGDAIGAMEYLAQLAGISPLEFKKNLRTQVMPEFEKWQQMSEEARKFKEIEEENNYFKQQRESEVAKIKAQESQKELDSKLKQAQEAHGFTDKDLVEAYDILAEHYKPEQINFELLDSYMKEHKAIRKTESLLEQVDTELLGNEKLLDSVADLVLKGRHSDEELLELIQNMNPKKSNRKKVESKVAASVDRKIENNTNKKAPVSWADLE